MSWGDEMEDLESEKLARSKAFQPIDLTDVSGGPRAPVTHLDTDRLQKEIIRLQKEKSELRGAVQRLLLKPRCARCRKAAQGVLDRIKIERVMGD